MTSIVAYQKVSTPHTTITLRLPDNRGVDDALRCTELCTLPDGTTYVALPDGVDLPEQAPELTVAAVVLTDALKDQIRAASPHVALINERMVHKIRAEYSIDDEMYFARIGVGAATGMYAPAPKELEEMAAFGAFVEGVRDWGRAERNRLGL
jgi:hypothetical protein